MTRDAGRAGMAADWPLALFTGLAGAGAGLLLAPLAALLAGRAAVAATPLAWMGLVLLAGGLAVSLAHLGRPPRALLAAGNLGRSRLSSEVVLGLAVVAAAGAALAWPSSRVAASASAVSALVFLLSVGLVYALPGQHAWRGPAAAAPLSTALALAVLSFAALEGQAAGAWRAMATTLLALDLVLFAWRVRRIGRIPFGHRPADPATFAHRRAVLAVRVALVTLVPLLLALWSRPLAAAAVLAVGILADRVSFYALAVRHTTEGEIEAIETVITA